MFTFEIKGAEAIQDTNLFRKVKVGDEYKTFNRENFMSFIKNYSGILAISASHTNMQWENKEYKRLFRKSFKFSKLTPEAYAEVETKCYELDSYLKETYSLDDSDIINIEVVFFPDDDSAEDIQEVTVEKKTVIKRTQKGVKAKDSILKELDDNKQLPF